MDAALVISVCNWIMAELIRVFHKTSIHEAQTIVDALSELRIPLIWQADDVKRVLDTTLNLRSQVLLLTATSPGRVHAEELLRWCDYKDRKYFFKLLRQLHSKRLIEYRADETLEILPPGSQIVSQLIAAKAK